MEQVDNVPLLVSIYTDSTPNTIDSMFSIFHDYYESVLCVGSAFRSTNAQLFRRADLSISFEGLPGMPYTSSLPPYSTTKLSVADARFNEDIISLYCAFSLRHGGSSKSNEKEKRVSVTILIDLVREGRRLLCCLYQMVALAAMILITSALLLLVSRIIPVHAKALSSLGLDAVLWIIWVVLPLLCLSLLHTPADTAILTRCPYKNQVIQKTVETYRTLSYFSLRCVPTVVFCLYIHARAVITLLDQIPEVMSACQVNTEGSIAGDHYSPLHRESTGGWWKLLNCHFVSQEFSSDVTNALHQADDLMLASLVLMLVIHSASLLYRTSALTVDNPFHNVPWVISCIIVLGLQAAHLVLRGWRRGSLLSIAGIGWDVWLVIAIGPCFALLIGEYAKRQDKKVFDKAVRFLRLQFDTRLGTYSPK